MPLRFGYVLCIAIGVAVGKSAAQSTNQTVTTGETTSFTVTATGSPTLTYQWFNGTNTLSNQAATSISATASQAFTELEQGHHLFETHCATCHGQNGEGAKGPTLALTALPRASDDASLTRIVAEGIRGTEMPAARMDEAELRLVVKFVKSLGSKPREALAGNVARGAQIYEKKGGCAICHMIHGEGGSFGPDLSDVGRRRSAAYLRRALVDPNADVPKSYSAWRAEVSLPENFLYVRLATRDGQELAGVRVNEDTFSIQIRDVNGAIHSFLKSELAELHKDFGKSPMPSFANALTKDELDDLVAYLASLRGKK